MYITVHAAAGAAIGTLTLNPILAFIGGFISHLILDMIPHGDEGIQKCIWFKTKMQCTIAAALIDFIGVTILLIFLINRVDIALLPSIIAGMAGGIAPDALWGFHELTKTPLLGWYRRWHTNGHNFLTKKKINIIQGLLVQIPFLAVFVWFALQ
ncbi:MAG: hypothetical protein QF747_02715 [Patescibacteria group bacterium]|jgi:hypothetical protein|nr:hypothetical protein [Patescibacteria group bacterium]MDP6756301.1 hypothetical protein [Patescibacteria group bacterium]|tara:strand:+ start:25126 stop:25587 length:462 start_codon:yes stop_codon:yes gene_type:complete